MDTHKTHTALPKVSVVITSYNYQKYIATSIESVLTQDYPNIELIVVDDCSSDDSQTIISRYKNKIVACFQDVNQGHGAAFNRGFAQASGDLVMFLDADDFLLPGGLSAAIKAFPADSSVCQFRMALVDADGKAYDIYPKPELEFDTAQRAENKLLHCGYYQTTVTSGLVFSRTYLEQVLPMPSEDFRQGGDGYLVSLAPLYGMVSSSALQLSGYRQHGDNHSSFTNQLLKRARWRIEHNRKRHKAILSSAQIQNRIIEDDFYLNDTGLLSEYMCLRLFDDNSRTKDIHSALQHRLGISKLAVKNLDRENVSLSNKCILALWWLSLALLPKNAAKPIYSWKVLASSRPSYITKASKILRKL
ncbi:glycosyltransferase [Vibrio sp. FNV 38]|nr:glycosyltransferase [Vibrio sp. FNV 38]